MPSLAEQQARFAELVRFPDLDNDLGVEDRRLAIYQRLVFNNVFGLVSRAFKRTYNLVGADTFRSWVRQFIQEGVSRTPYFSEISAEFSRWLAHQPVAPKLVELIQYERAIIALDVDAQTPPDYRIELNCRDTVVLQPASCLLNFQYAVHEVSTSEPIEPEHRPVWLLLFRNPHNKLRFKQLSPAAYALITLLESGMSIASACEQLTTHLNTPPDKLESFALSLLADLQREGGVLGAKV